MHYSARLCVTSALLLTLTELTTQTDVLYGNHEGSACQLHTGERGICKNSQKCNWLINQLVEKRIRFEDIRRCSFSGLYDDIVCCGDRDLSQPLDDKLKPCEVGIYFDLKCEDGIKNQNRGAKIRAACSRYSALAKPFRPPHSIIKGKTADAMEFPHMAALGYPDRENTNYTFDCGATLISEQWVITAAHCVGERRRPTIVRFGRIFLYSEDDIGFDRTIVQIVRNSYSVLNKKNDIALVQFVGSIEFNDFIRPACVHTELEDIPETENLSIAGWGTIEPERTNRSEALLKANVFTVPLEKCNNTLIDANYGNLASLRGLIASQMCASNLAVGSDACQGDSGGPLFIHDRSTGVSTIVGIVSFGISCGTDLPGVYSRVGSFVEWIESTIWP